MWNTKSGQAEAVVQAGDFAVAQSGHNVTRLPGVGGGGVGGSLYLPAAAQRHTAPACLPLTVPVWLPPVTPRGHVAPPVRRRQGLCTQTDAQRTNSNW